MRAPTVPRLLNTEVPDPYPHQSGGQQLGVLEACPFKPLHVFWLLLFFYNSGFNARNMALLKTLKCFKLVSCDQYLKVHLC